MAQCSRGPAHAAARHGLSIAEVIYICRTVQKKVTTIQDQLDVHLAAGLDTVAMVKRWIADAIFEADKSNGSRIKGMWEPEFSQTEFSSTGKRPSYFHWLFETLSFLPASVAKRIFGPDAAEFMKICRRTLEGRARRQKKAVDAVRAGVKPISRSNVVEMRSMAAYPTPSRSPQEIADVLINHHYQQMAA